MHETRHLSGSPAVPRMESGALRTAAPGDASTVH